MKPSAPIVFTDPRESVLYRLKANDVVLCHDLGPVTHPDLYGRGVDDLYKLAYKRICVAKPHLLFVSNSSRQSFIELYGDRFPLMDVVHIPLRDGIESGPLEPVEGLPERYLLTVGSIGARKNQKRCIDAFVSSALQAEGVGYVLCGGLEPGSDAVMESASRTPGVIVTGYVTDGQLRWLYAHAEGFVLPSLLEGFGLPAAEAIAHGLVPMVPKDGALYEVTGDAAVLVDASDTDMIAQGMRMLVEMDEHERNSRLTALRQSIARFSREATFATWRSALFKALRSEDQWLK